MSFGAFFQLGVEHIFTGCDHLLFLIGLPIVCTRASTLMVIVSSFTVGHSLTLGLATFRIIPLPPASVTEPLIAATIVIVGLQNLWWRNEEPAARWLLALFFGMIHGFGFATILRDLGVGADGSGITMPLLGFNLGVETGQLAMAAVVLPLLWVARQYPFFVRRGAPVLSALVVVTGVYWFFERTLLN
jgi:hydrogenase/urease accessory protein HupE